MNLVSDDILRVRTRTGVQAMSLPRLLHALGAGDVADLVGLQRHQSEPFHVFASALAAMVLARHGSSDPRQSDSFWENGLVQLAGSARSAAWDMVATNSTQAAFMQPPLPPGNVGPAQDYLTPDALDLLSTAKNHEIKSERITAPHIDEWLYALISLQTMSGYLGRGNNGISRMNSGFGNRPIVELVRSEDRNVRWRDAVVRLLQHRVALLDMDYNYNPQGIALVWADTWDGASSLTLSSLDPLYIEVCRRIRLHHDSGAYPKIIARHYPAETTRISAKELKGIVGDPWLPVDTRKNAALTVSSGGFTPEDLRRIVFGEDMRLSALQRPMETWQGDTYLKCTVTVRGQGKTDGYYEKSVLLPAEIRRRLFGDNPAGHSLSELSKGMIDLAGKMRSVLKAGVFAALQGGADNVDFDRRSFGDLWKRYSGMFQSLWALHYFPWLWAVPDKFDMEQQLKVWAQDLRGFAESVLNEALSEIPLHSGRIYRSKIMSRRVFYGMMFSKKNFPFLLQTEQKGGQ